MYVPYPTYGAVAACDLLAYLRRYLPRCISTVLVSSINSESDRFVVVCVEFSVKRHVRPPGRVFDVMQRKGLGLLSYRSMGSDRRYWELLASSMDYSYYAYWSVEYTEEQYIERLRVLGLVPEHADYIMRCSSLLLRLSCDNKIDVEKGVVVKD